MRASQEGHARRMKKWNGATTTPPRSRLANFRLASIDEEPPVFSAIREDGGAGGIQADGVAESAPTEKGATAADSATPEEETPAKKGQRRMVSV